MRALVVGSVLLALAAGHHPVAATGHHTATIQGELATRCAGCGTTGASFTGTVVSGSGRYVPGARVSGFFSLAQQGVACGPVETAKGDLTSNGAVLTALSWTRTGVALQGATADGSTVAGTSAYTSPAANACGGPAISSVTLTIGRPPAPRDVRDTAVSTALGAYEQVQHVRRDTRDAASVVVDPVLGAAAGTPLRSWVDGIHIVAQTSFGGPYPVYEGAFADPALWDCTAVMYPGTPTVTCTADPTSGIDWECGLMHAQAKSMSENDFDEPWITYWGRAAAYVSCDSDVLVTAQANQGNPITQAQTPMGAVTTVVCKAQFDSNDGSPAQPPYHVICVDPPYATAP